MGCGAGVLKYLLFIFNFIFALCGLALVIYGIVLKAKYKEEVSTGLIVLGCIIFVISFFGFCGAIRESHCMLITFTVFLILLLIIQLSIAVISIIALKKVNVEQLCQDEVASLFNNFDTKGDVEPFYNYQLMNGCCGYNGASDFARKWTNGTLPPSCCSELKETCRTTDEDYHDISCLDFCSLAVYLAGVVTIVPLMVVGFIELLGIIFAITLMCAFKRTIRKSTFA